MAEERDLLTQACEQYDVAVQEIVRLKSALLLLRGRLLMENPSAVTSEADTLLAAEFNASGEAG